MNEGLQIRLVELELVGDALEMLDGDPGRHFVTLGDPDGVNSPLEEALGLLEKRAGHDDDAGGSVADFVVLTPRELHHQLRDLVVHVHLVKDRGSIVRCKTKKRVRTARARKGGSEASARGRSEKLLTDGDVAVGALEHLVHAFGAEGGSEDASDGFAGGDVGFLSVQTSKSALLLLFLQDYERPSELVESQRHFRSLFFQSHNRTIAIQRRRRRRKRRKDTLKP